MHLFSIADSVSRIDPSPNTQYTIRSHSSSGEESHRWRLVFFGMVAMVVLFMLLKPFLLNIRSSGTHYLYMASHLVRGDLTIDSMPGGPDYVMWQGHKYLPLPPLPGVALIPFLPVMQPGQVKDMVWAGYLFTVPSVWLLWKVLGQIGVVGARRNWTLLLFFGGTV